MSTAMPQATMNGQPLNWGQAPAQSNGKRWGRLAVKLAVVVGAAFVLGNIGVDLLGLGEGAMKSVFQFGGVSILGALGLTDAAAEGINYLAGLNSSGEVIEAGKQAFTSMADGLNPSSETFVLKDFMTAVSSSAAVESATNGVTQLQTYVNELANNVPTSEEAIAAANQTLNTLVQQAQQGIETAGTTAGIALEQISSAKETLAEYVRDEATKIAPGITGREIAAGVGGAGIAITANNLMSAKNRAPQAANQNRVPPAPHPSAIRPNAGRMSAKFHNQDLANHLQASGFEVGSATQPQHRTI